MLSDHALPASMRLERVELQVGPLRSSLAGSDACIYFPIDALLTLGSASSLEHGLAVVGCHAGVESPSVSGTGMQAFVRVPGQTYKMDWPPAQDDPALYAACLWHAAASTQGLIRQMAQWFFCLKNHTREQSLCAWLLQCLAHYPGKALSVHLALIPQSIRPEMDHSKSAESNAHVDSGYRLALDQLHVLSPQRLAQRACSCHQKQTRVDSANG